MPLIDILIPRIEKALPFSVKGMIKKEVGAMWPIAALIVGKFIYDLNKACNMDEDSRRRMMKAFQRETEARLLVRQKSQELDRKSVV